MRLAGPEGDERRQFLAGEPLGLRVRVEAARPLPAPRLSWELRDESGLLLAGGIQDLGELAWAPSGSSLRFDVPELPLADGRFRLRLGLTDAAGEHLYHQLDDAATFVVYPAGDERGVVRVEGRWSREEIAAPAEIGRP